MFVHVSQNATRLLGLRVFKQLHELSLRFHLDRQTGGLSLSIERGTRCRYRTRACCSLSFPFCLR